MADESQGVPQTAVSNEISGGLFFHAVIQGRDITVQLPPQITPALSGLPSPSPTFTGRDHEVDMLLQSLAPDRTDGKPTLVSAVAGMAGVGKTELVQQVTHRALKHNGWFPGGALFVDLFGYDNKHRLTPEHALEGMLRALGLPGEHIPNQLQDRSRLYRSVLAAYAEQRKRILVVIDNASTAAQAKPLLPSDGTTGALVTSRHTLDIGARLHDLDVLDPEPAVDLIRQALCHARGSNDTRVDDQLQEAKTIAELCGRLPLALQIVATLLADIPTRPLASMAEDLADVQRRLGELRREEKAVRAAFDLSYQHLNAEQSHLFRLLPLNPGPDISTEATSHLADADQPTTRRLLEDLARAHLVEPGRMWGRWRMHDLLRMYAHQRGTESRRPGSREAALTRLLEYYATTAKAADKHLRALPGQPAPETFTGRKAALAWLDTEHANLISAVATARSTGHLDTAIRLPASLSEYLLWRRYFDDWITVTTIARETAHITGDQRGEATAWNNLGLALQEMRRFDDAIAALEHARHLFQQTDDRPLAARTWNNLGLVLQEVGRFDEAVTAHTHARGIHQDLGDHHREAMARNNLGLALQEVARFDEAIAAHTHARGTFHDLGDHQREATAWNNLGLALRQVGRFDEAIAAHIRAGDLFEQTGDHHGEADAWNNLGLVLQEVGRFDEAIAAHIRAGDLFEQTGDHHGEGRAWANLGLALEAVGRMEEAVGALKKGVAACRATGDLRGAAFTWQSLAKIHTRAGQLAQAQAAWEGAAMAYQEAGDYEEAEQTRALHSEAGGPTL